MQLYKQERAFLIYFLPLFAVKLINITADNIILQTVAIISFSTFIAYFNNKKYPKKLMRLYVILGVYSAMLVVTCGKQGVFFSVIAVILMRGIDFKRVVYKWCLYIGVLFLILSCYIERNTGDADSIGCVLCS